MFLDDEIKRFQIFRDHVRYVLQANLDLFRTFELELNEFSDWTIEEFNLLKKGLVMSTSLRRRYFNQINLYDDDDSEDSEESVRRSLNKLYQHHFYQRRVKRSYLGRRRVQLDERRGFTNWFWDLINGGSNSSSTTTQTSNSFDWRSKNMVGSIKNQLNCGCCYAFATAAVLESLYAIKTKASSVVELSPQQITDCSSNGNSGCGGGNFPPSVRYVTGQGNRLATHASYPYAGKKQVCQSSGVNYVNLGTIQYDAIPQGDEATMAKTLVSNGPIFIGLDADSRQFMFYKAGVLNIAGCPTRRQDMDHAMVAVGYGYDSALKSSYWIVKNSWGEKWGENGYLRLAKDKANMCGIASMAYYAKLT